MARNMATLLTADLHPSGGPEIWSGNQISTSLSSRIPVQTDENGCPVDTQQFPRPTLLLKKMAPLWEHGFHKWAQILGRASGGRPYFLEARGLIWANPQMSFPLPQDVTRALSYLRATLASLSTAHWQSLKKMITRLDGWDDPIAFDGDPSSKWIGGISQKNHPP